MERIISEIITKLFDQDVSVQLTRPDSKFGDFATNAALQLAKPLGKNPREIAEAIAEELRGQSLIMAYHERRPVKALYDVGHGERFARTRNAEQRRRSLPVTKRLDYSVYRLRLIPCRFVFGMKFEIHDPILPHCPQKFYEKKNIFSFFCECQIDDSGLQSIAPCTKTVPPLTILPGETKARRLRRLIVRTKYANIFRIY